MKKEKTTTRETDSVKFQLGSILLRPDVLHAISKPDLDGFLSRHERGDWGEIGYQGEQLNKQGLKRGEKLVSMYETDGRDLVIVVTERDRKTTFVAMKDDPVWEMMLADVATTTAIATH